MRSPNRRIIAIAVVVLLWPAATHAKDCMTKAEARKVYRTSYLYWHGKGRCWDASPRASHRHQKVGAVRHRVEAAQKAPKPEVKAELQTPAERTLTPDDLRTKAFALGMFPVFSLGTSGGSSTMWEMGTPGAS